MGEKPPKTQDEKVLIEVDRSKIEREQQAELEKRASDLALLNEKYLKSVKELQELKEKDQQETTKFKGLEDERDRFKDQLREIAMVKFNEEKRVAIEKFGKTLPPEKVKELEEQIKTPSDLQSIGFALTVMEQMQQSVAEREKEAAAAAAQAAGNTPSEGTEGVVDLEGNTKPPAVVSSPQKPPGGSVVRTPTEQERKLVFKTAKEGIDTLYERLKHGDREADKLLNQLWEKAFQTIKSTYGRLEMAVTECPVCGTGIESGTKCPYCEFDPATYIARGGEFW